MRKLISNNAAAKIKRKHTKAEIENGIITLVKVETIIDKSMLFRGMNRQKEMLHLLQSKLFEELDEIHTSKKIKEAKEEIDDLILVAQSLKAEIDDKPHPYDQGWILKNCRGALKKKQ